MKVLLINEVCGRTSTGRICTDIAVELEKQGHIVKIAYGRDDDVPEQYRKYAIRIGTDFDVKLHALKTRLFDENGFGSKKATGKFVEWVKRFDPDIIHLHNLHGYYININLLFVYLKKSNKKIIWTLHDCWAFTGHCAYFDYIQCNKWKYKCDDCPQKKNYPTSWWLDGSKKNYERKKLIFSNVPNLTIVTPSYWLKNLVGQSILRQYEVEVIHNGVDTASFKPTRSDIRFRYHLRKKKIVLGVASIWEKRKGLDCFLKLSEVLSNSYQIVLIGLSKKQLKELPGNIIGIERTECVKELAAWYTAAYVFVNPTLEDNYPTTNLEAIACGTPVVTFATGGSGESAEMFGFVLQNNNLENLVNAIENIDKATPKSIHVDYRETIKEYLMIY